MRIFISWSGDRSKFIAEALREWLPNVIQAAKPWISTHDIASGTRWATEVGTQLELTSYGILCLTPENLESTWLLFEAGAISKSLPDSFVVPYLFDTIPSALVGPLAQFQARVANQEETKLMIETINSACGGDLTLEPTRLDAAFDRWWPDLQGRLASVPSASPTEPPPAPRSLQSMVEEMLDLIRHPSRPALFGSYNPPSALTAAGGTRWEYRRSEFLDFPEVTSPAYCVTHNEQGEEVRAHTRRIVDKDIGREYLIEIKNLSTGETTHTTYLAHAPEATLEAMPHLLESICQSTLETRASLNSRRDKPPESTSADAT